MIEKKIFIKFRCYYDEFSDARDEYFQDVERNKVCSRKSSYSARGLYNSIRSVMTYALF